MCRFQRSVLVRRWRADESFGCQRSEAWIRCVERRGRWAWVDDFEPWHAHRVLDVSAQRMDLRHGYSLSNSHWISILVELGSDDQHPSYNGDWDVELRCAADYVNWQRSKRATE